MRRRRSGKAFRKQFCSIVLAAALVMGSVMPAFAAEGGTIASEEETAVSESAAENGAVDGTEQITPGEGTEQVTSGDGSEQITSDDGTDQETTDGEQTALDNQETPDDQTALDEQENSEGEEPVSLGETDEVTDQNAVPVPAADEPVEGATVPEVFVSTVEGLGDDDSEEMFAEYVERLFEGEGTRKRAKKAVGSKFEGATLFLYTELRNGAEQVASGQRASTEFAFDVEDLGYGRSVAWSASELGVEAVVVGSGISQEASDAAFQKFEEELQTSAILDALLADCPYELYWYDKTQGVSKGSGIGATYSGGEWKCYIKGQYTFSFAVASEFSAGEYTADTSKTGAATAAVSNAQDILSAANGLSDLEKLNYYKEEICDLVSYNDAAAGGGIAYGNPWQLVWVFDGDTSTNVVCEGYSKAFQYLCDKTNFSSNRVSAISPTGVMSGGMGAGRHMWNIVTLDDGWNYLADVTNSDTGTAGSNGDLFLVPYTSGSVENGYTFLCFGTNEIHYSYDADCIDLFSAENLTLSANPYGTNPLPEPLEITSQPQDVIATDGQNITLHVEANKTDVSYQWQWSDDGENWVNCTFDGAFTDTLSFMAKEIVHGMYFRCVVSNTNESVNSEAAQVMVDPIEHSYGDWVVTVEPTCTEDGSREKVCTICGDKVTEAIPATGHAYGDWTVTTAATCTEDGSREKVCANCGDKVTETISATGHVWEEEYTVDKEATCTEEGSESIHCSVCDAINETTVHVIPKTEHTYGDWTVTKEVTCTEDGSREKVCANCGDKITETITATGHAYGDWTVTKEATCTGDGSRERVCANCGDKITEEIPATGHEWLEWTVVREATEEEDGLERRTCSNDPSHTEERIIPMLTHVHELIKTEAKEASCTEDGNVEFWTCSKCGRVYSDSEGVNGINPEETIIHAEGHKWDTEYTVDKEATCTEEGAESIHCSVCGEIDENSVQVIPATGHAYGDWTVTKEATCTEAGSREKVCANCEEKITETISATGHIWNDYYTRDVEPTATEEGSESIHCSICDAIDESTTRSIPILVLKGTWKQDRNGWWYDRGDGTYPKDGFEEIEGTTYYFGPSGYMKTGWVEDEGAWYYFAASGAMGTDWQKINNVWYYFDDDGEMQTGLQEISGAKYYFTKSGAMKTGWQQADGIWYYFAASGAAVKGWQQISGVWYYFNDEGEMRTGLQTIGGKQYYFEASGAMATGWKQLDGTWYYFDASGAGTTGWQKIGSIWYYFNNEGKMLTGLQKIGNATYYFGSNGAMATGWQKIDNAWYYFESSGAMATSKWVGDYYMLDDGVMATNQWIDGKYYVGADGKWIPGYAAAG